MKKEEIYIPLEGKSKEKLKEVCELFKGELTTEQVYTNLQGYRFLTGDGYAFYNRPRKTEITIQQLKETLQPMETFTPIAMKCKQEQFEAIKPKLKGFSTEGAYDFDTYVFLTNYYNSVENRIGNISENVSSDEVKVYKRWNEEVFLKACGIEAETLQEKQTRLTNELNEVNRLIEEENKPKVGDWVWNKLNSRAYKKTGDRKNEYETKITDQELIKKLNELIK